MSKPVTYMITTIMILFVAFMTLQVIRACNRSAFGEEVPSWEAYDECIKQYEGQGLSASEWAQKCAHLKPKKVEKISEKSKKTWDVWDKEKYGSMADGIRDGMGWCMNPENKCYSGIRNRLKKRASEYSEWFGKYAGGYLPYHFALTSATEAPAGPHQCSPDLKLKECGIMGLKMLDAMECDIDVCDPEASIWCAGWQRNKAMIAFEEKYPQVKQAPRYDRYVLSIAGGGVGQVWYNAIEHSGALDIDPKTGKLKYEKPLQRVLDYMSLPSKRQHQKFVDSMSGNRVTAYKIGLRAGRHIAVMKIVAEAYGVSVDELPYRDPMVIERPEHLPKFPGVKKHGKCKVKNLEKK